MISNILPLIRVTYISYLNKSLSWKSWKYYQDCTDEEIKRINLRQIFPNEVVLDVEVEDDRVDELLNKEKLHYSIIKTGSRGKHYHLLFDKLENYRKEFRNKLRQYYIEKFECDISKKSEDTLISIENTKHFKTDRISEIIKEDTTLNIIPLPVESWCNSELEEEMKFEILSSNMNKDTDFEKYFEEDPFFKYLISLENPLVEGMSRNNTILKNLAIACNKSNKDPKFIKDLITALMDKIMPDIPYAQFSGWLRKGLPEYNYYEINGWGRAFAKKEFYNLDLKLLELPKTLNQKIKSLNIDELSNEKLESLLLEIDKQEWAVRENALTQLAYKSGINKQILQHKSEEIKMDNGSRRIITGLELINMDIKKPEYWIYPIIPKGAVIIVGGKPGSFKSMFVSSMSYYLINNKNFLGTEDFKVSETTPKILYYDLENGMNLQHWRLQYLISGLNCQKENLKNISFAESFNKIQMKKELELAKNYDIIILDSYRRFLEGSENDSEVTNKFYKEFLSLLKEMGKTVIIIHHLRKQKIEDFGESEFIDTFRGSGDITAQLDVVLGVIKSSDMETMDKEIMFNVNIIKAKVRNIYPIKDFNMGVTRDDKNSTTRLSFLGFGRPKSLKENKEIEIFNFIKKQAKEVSYDDLKESINMPQTTLKRYLNSMIESRSITRSGHGKYSA